jgi:hypothetical protein
MQAMSRIHLSIPVQAMRSTLGPACRLDPACRNKSHTFSSLVLVFTEVA